MCWTLGRISSGLANELEDVESVGSVIGNDFTCSGFNDVASVGSVIGDNFTCSGFKDVASVGSVSVVDCVGFDDEDKEGKVVLTPP